MKKIFTLLVMVALATCWVSCSDDDNDDNANWQEIRATLEITDPTKESSFYCYTSSTNITTCETIIDWGDGIIDENKNTHYYSQKGTYYVTIKVKKIKKLDSMSPMTSLDLSELTELTDLSLSLYSSSLNSLDLSNNIKLITLSCGNSLINSINLKSNTELNELIVHHNYQLTSLDLSNNTKLTRLTCYNNQLTSLDLSKNIELTSLDCSSNQLTSLDLSKNTELSSLSFSFNQLTSLDLNKNTKLKYLACENNPFTQETVNALLNSLPMGKYLYGEPQSILYISYTLDASIAEEKGWRVFKV